LRERILQLRSEQETKRLQETKKRGVNRSQSNTRTQSVRRTSIRDKTIITKKDAVEEARRLAQEVSSLNVMLVWMGWGGGKSFPPSYTCFMYYLHPNLKNEYFCKRTVC
jgi:hypothetical protein